MADQIQNIPLGLLAATANPAMVPLAGLLPSVPVARSSPPPQPQRPFAGLFGGQPAGYTPQDVQRVLGEQGDMWQRFPITQQWNGGRGLGGIGPGIANFGSGFMSTALPGQQLARAQENERIRREAADRASGATTLEDAVAALTGGSPEQSAAALQLRLQGLAADRERDRKAAVAAQIYGPPGGSTAPTAPGTAPLAPETAPPTAPPSTTASAAPQQPSPMSGDWSQFLSPPPGPDRGAYGALADAIGAPSGTQAPVQVQPQYQNPYAALATAVQQNGQPSTAPSVAAPPPFPVTPAGTAPPPTGGQPPPSAPGTPPTAPAPTGPGTAQQQPPPSLPPQTEPIVQFGQYRFPLSEALRRASGVDVKPLEDAISVAQKELEKAAELRATAQANLPSAMQATNSLVRNIDWMLDNPGEVSRVTGTIQGSPGYDNPPFYSPLAYLPEYSTIFGGTSRADVTERIRQVTGQTFMQAFNAIKGAGSISDQEGAAARAAITRLENRAQSDEQYRLAVVDARREVWELVNVARARAGQPPIPYQPHASEPRRQGSGAGQSGAVGPGTYDWTPNGGMQPR